MNNTISKTVGELVADDYRTAAVFEAHGIDFCCKGNRTISQACEQSRADEQKVLEAIEAVRKTPDSTSTPDFTSWPLDLLIDYIEKKHHRYVAERTPLLMQYLDKLCKVHGKHHAELHDVYRLFADSAHDLAAHMKKEELILFPFIRKMTEVQGRGLSLATPHFGTVENPVHMMREEHEQEGERFRQIADFTSGYTPPPDACNTYRVTYALLKEFEADLHLHIHLENNILFPAAIELEHQLTEAV